MTGVVHVSDLNEQVMKIFLFFVEGDGHGEQILEFSDECVEEHDYFEQYLAVFEYLFLLAPAALISETGAFPFLGHDHFLLLFQVQQIVVEDLFDMVSFDALIFHLDAFLAQALVDVDDEIGQALSFDVVGVFEPIYHFMPLDSILFKVAFLYLFESDFGGLFCFDLLELFFFDHEELQQFLQARHKLSINFDVVGFFLFFFFGLDWFPGGMLVAVLVLQIFALQFLVLLPEGGFESFETSDGVLLAFEHLFVGTAVDNFHCVCVALDTC